MPRQLPSSQTKRLLKFPIPLQGLNTTAPSLVLTKGFSPFARGIRFARGEVSTTPASAIIDTTGLTATPINSAFTSHQADGTIITVVGQTTTLGTYIFGGNQWSSVTVGGTALGTDEDRWSFADVFGDIYASNGVGLVVVSAAGGEWINVATQLSLASSTSPFAYSGRYLESFAGRLMMANVREGGIHHEDRLRWSVAQSPQDFTSDSSAGANDIVDLAGPITGMCQMAGRLFVHKRTGITVVLETGLRTPSFSFQTAIDGIGTIAGHTLLVIRGAQLFLGADDIFVYDGSSAPIPIGEPIRKELFANLNWAKVGNSFALDYADLHEYHLFVPEGTNQWPNVEYVFNYIDRTWAKNTIVGTATAGALVQIAPPGDTWDFGDDSPTDDTWDGGQDNVWDAPAEVVNLVPFWGRSDGGVRRFDETATALPAVVTLTTADWDCDSPGMLKSIDRIRVTVRQRNAGTLSLSVSTNGGATFTTPVNATISAPVGDENALQTLFFPVSRVTGEFFRLKLTSGDRFSLVSWEIETIDREEVK